MAPVLWPLTATFLLQAMASMQSIAVPVLAPLVVADLGLDASRIGLFSACNAAGVMAFQLMSARFLPRFGALRLLQLGLALQAAALAAVGFGLWWLALTAALLIGFGYGPSPAAGSHILAKTTPAGSRGFVFSVKQAAVPLGGIFAGLVLPWVALRAGWEAALLVSGGCALLAGLSVQPLRRTLDADRDPRRPLDLATLVSWQTLLAPVRAHRLDRALPWLTLAGVGFAVLQGCTFSFYTTFLVHEAKLGLAEAGLAFSAMQTVGIVGRVGSGWVADRALTPRRMLMLLGAAGLLAAALTATVGPAWPFPAIVTLAAASGFAVASWNGLYLAEVARVAPPGAVGEATAGSTFFTFLGYVLGPAAFSGLVALTDSYAAAFVMAGLAALAAALAVSRAR